MRVFVAIAAAAMLVAGLVAPHHHSPSGGAHECVACSVGSGLEARGATPVPSAPPPSLLAVAVEPPADPVIGAPLGAIPGQSPPLS